MNKKAVLIGAGQFGRGVIGMLLSQSGYDVLMADINTSVIEDINARHEYTVKRKHNGSSEYVVGNVSGIDARDPALPDRCAEADIICTCVGLTAIPVIAHTIAESIQKRFDKGNSSFINVLACENALGGSTILKQYVMHDIAPEIQKYLEKYVGFPDCAIDGIIPPDVSALPADVTAEEYYEWDSLKRGFRGELPQINGLNIVDNLSKYLERKLFTLNGPNAVTGCMGHRKGYETVQDALEDREIYRVVWGMMKEAGAILIARHGFTESEMAEYRKFIMDRFKNTAVIDRCDRVAREPIRKLASNDRIIAPMNFALEAGIETPSYYEGIAYVMAYDNPNDLQSAEIQKMIAKYGFADTLERLTGIGQESDVCKSVSEKYYEIINK